VLSIAVVHAERLATSRSVVPVGESVVSAT